MYQKCFFGQFHNPQNKHQKLTRLSDEEAEYQIPNLSVDLRYLKIC
jgi:hypothetical protein